MRTPGAVDGLTLYREHPNVVVMRTFSKAYGLAGLRVGMAIGPAPVISAIRKCSIPFGVSDIAQKAAIASLAAENALMERPRRSSLCGAEWHPKAPRDPAVPGAVLERRAGLPRQWQDAA